MGETYRLTNGRFEMGSTFKAFTIAMALDSGRYNLNSMVDVRAPLHYGRFNINDYHAHAPPDQPVEVFTYSSNIGAAIMARSLGVTDPSGSCASWASSIKPHRPSCRNRASRCCRSVRAR